MTNADYLKHNTFAQRLAIALEVSRISQTELCGRTGIDGSVMSHYVNGGRKPGLDNLAAMLPHLKVDPAWLICGAHQSDRSKA